MASRPQLTRGEGLVQAMAVLLAVAVLALALLLYIVWLPKPPVPDPVPPPPVACSGTFLGPNDFEGQWQPRVANALSGAASTFNGSVAFGNVSRQVVDDVLPGSWQLAEPKSASEQCHPVLILYGHQTETSMFIFGTELDIGGSDDEYTEMMLLIPFVQRPGIGPKMHSFVVRMFLNDQVAKSIGNMYYGYAKEDATFTETATAFTVFPDQYPAFHATASMPGTWQNFTQATIANLSTIREILDMPVIGKRQDPFAYGGAADQCSYFEMEYVHNDNTEARVRTIQIEHRYLQQLAPGMTFWPSLGPIVNSQGGAIQIEDLKWRISFPPLPYCTYK